MNELLNEILKQLKDAWRFRWWGLGAAWGICVIGWLVVSAQQPMFEASARVFVDTKSMLRSLLDEQIVDSTLDEQLGFVREAMLGTAELENIARATGLLEPNASADEILGVVAGLQSTIQIRSLNDSLPRAVRLMRAPSEDTYTITYVNSNRDLAVDVVSRLLTSFEQNAISGKRSSSAEAGVFLREQLTIYEDRLRDAEDRLAAFNRKNYDRLPNLQGGYFRELQDQSSQLEESKKNLNLIKSRLQSIENRLRGESWVSDSSEIDPSSTQGRLRSTQQRLDELLLRFTASHPDVQALQESLEILKQKRTEEMEMLAQGDAEVLSDNPVYQALQISKNEAEAELATIQADVNVRQDRLDYLRGLIDEMPEVEAELSQLNRDYEVVQSNYQSLLSNLERERLSSEVVASDDIEFRVIDPPSSPTSPVSIAPFLLHAAVFLIGLGGAAVVAYLMAQLRPVVNSVSDLGKILDAPFLGTVSRISSAVRLNAGETVFFYGLIGALVVAFLLVIYAEIMWGGLLGLH